MSNNEDNTEEPSQDDGGSEAASTGLKDELSDLTGKDFDSEEEARKWVEETNSYVGKAGKYEKAVSSVMESRDLDEDEAVEYIQNHFSDSSNESGQNPSDDNNEYLTKDEFERMQFYNNNPEYEDHKELIDSLAEANDQSPSEVVESDEFNKLYEPAKAQKNSEDSKSVIHSNSRLGEVSDKMDEANEALEEGDERAAQNKAVGAVMEKMDQ
jgi:hypothetical protein